MRSDAAYVNSTLDDPKMDSETFGVPLTSSEVADVSSRASFDLHAVLAHGLDDPSEFGGVWVDQRNGGLVHLELVDGAPAQNWLDRMPDGAKVVVDRVLNTNAALNETLERMSTDLASGTIRFGYAYVSPRDNAVVVVSDDPAVADFSARYGPVIVVEGKGTVVSSGCPDDSCSSQYWGGINISAPKNGGGTYSCSTSWMFNGLNGSTNTDFIMTAGHCGTHTSQGSQHWIHPNSASVGNMAAWDQGGTWGRRSGHRYRPAWNPIFLHHQSAQPVCFGNPSTDR